MSLLTTPIWVWLPLNQGPVVYILLFLRPTWKALCAPFSLSIWILFHPSVVSCRSRIVLRLSWKQIRMMISIFQQKHTCCNSRAIVYPCKQREVTLFFQRKIVERWTNMIPDDVFGKIVILLYIRNIRSIYEVLILNTCRLQYNHMHWITENGWYVLVFWAYRLHVGPDRDIFWFLTWKKNLIPENK